MDEAAGKIEVGIEVVVNSGVAQCFVCHALCQCAVPGSPLSFGPLGKFDTGESLCLSGHPQVDLLIPIAGAEVYGPSFVVLEEGEVAFLLGFSSFGGVCNLLCQWRVATGRAPNWEEVTLLSLDFLPCSLMGEYRIIQMVLRSFLLALLAWLLAPFFVRTKLCMFADIYLARLLTSVSFPP
jgi:hypothetical protein